MTPRLAIDIWNQIEDGFKRRDDAFVKSVFERYKESSSKMIPKGSFCAALRAASVTIKDSEAGDYFLSMDVNRDGEIDLQEFIRAVRMPSTVEQWASNLPLAQMISDAILERTDQEPENPLRNVRDHFNRT
jgi:hypothetical protein